MRTARAHKSKISPRGLSLPEAAAYVGVSVGTFNALVGEGRMPHPVKISERRFVYDLRELDSAFERLPRSA